MSECEKSVTIDWDRPVQTRDECEVEIYTTSGKNPECPVVGEYRDDTGTWILFKRPANGKAYNNCDDNSDLVNVLPQQYTVWLNVYRESGWAAQAHESKDKADRNASGDRIACFEHTFTEGEGLEREA